MYQAPDPNRPEASHRMFVQANPTLFGSTPSDDFNENAHGRSTGTRNTARDATAYATEPTQREWPAHVVEVVKKGGGLP